MRNYQFLGQVNISAGAGFGGGVSPWGVGAMPSGWNYRNAQGGTLMTEQVNSPEHAYEEKHCYRSPAGEYVSIALGDRDRYLAAGYVVVDTSNCGGAAMNAMNGRRAMGQAAPTPAPAAAPAPTIKPNAPVVLGIGTAGGAILGYVLSLVLVPRMHPRKSKSEVADMAKYGALGGAIGGLTGVGTMLLFKS